MDPLRRLVRPRRELAKKLESLEMSNYSVGCALLRRCFVVGVASCYLFQLVEIGALIKYANTCSSRVRPTVLVSFQQIEVNGNTSTTEQDGNVIVHGTLTLWSFGLLLLIYCGKPM